MKNEEIKMEKLLRELRKERCELAGKINRLTMFRKTDEWKELTSTHKQLLDIQLEAMKTYSEALTGRCIEIQERMAEQETVSKPEDNKDEDEPRVIVINIKEFLEKIKD